MTTPSSLPSMSSLLRSGPIVGGSIYSEPRRVLDIWINGTSAEQRSREMRQEFDDRLTGEATAAGGSIANCMRT
jgi:hypothetical protein